MGHTVFTIFLLSTFSSIKKPMFTSAHVVDNKKYVVLAQLQNQEFPFFHFVNKHIRFLFLIITVVGPHHVLFYISLLFQQLSIKLTAKGLGIVLRRFKLDFFSCFII